jgi:hypothetical protein
LNETEPSNGIEFHEVSIVTDEPDPANGVHPILSVRTIETRDELVERLARVLQRTTRGDDPWTAYARAAVDLVYDAASPLWDDIPRQRLLDEAAAATVIRSVQVLDPPRGATVVVTVAPDCTVQQMHRYRDLIEHALRTVAGRDDLTVLVVREGVKIRDTHPADPMTHTEGR